MERKIPALSGMIAALLFTSQLQGQPSAFMADAMALRGTIDKYPVTMFLNRYGENLAGDYWYDRTGEPITVYGSMEKGVLKLEAETRSEDDKGETFLLKRDGDGWTGTWEMNGTGRKLNVTLAARKDLPAMRMVQVVDSMSAIKGKGEPMARFQATLSWPTGNTPKEAFLRQEYLSCLGPDGARATDPVAQARVARSAYFKEYAGQVKDVKPSEIREMPQAYNWSRELRISVASLWGDLLSLECFMYEYSGGAHGLGASQYKLLDLGNQKVLKQVDILTPDGIRALPKLLEKHFRRTWRVKPGMKLEDAGLLVDKIEAETYNFFLTERAMVFSFAPYEIAAYVYGEVRIPVPLSDLKPYLKPAFAQMVGHSVK